MVCIDFINIVNTLVFLLYPQLQNTYCLTYPIDNRNLKIFKKNDKKIYNFQ